MYYLPLLLLHSAMSTWGTSHSALTPHPPQSKCNVSESLTHSGCSYQFTLLIIEQRKVLLLHFFAPTPVEVAWKEEGPPLPLVGLQHLRTCCRVVIVIILVITQILIVIVILVVIGK